VTEALTVWAVSFAAIVIAFLIYRKAAPLVATVSFLYLPLWLTRRRGEELAEYGLTLRRWRQDLSLFLLLAAVITPLFLALSWGFYSLLPELPHWLAARISPVVSAPHLHPRLPAHFPRWVLTELLVVALPEELFYRGFIQSRLRDAWPQGRLLWGARLGRAFWLTAVLFAFGHLAVFQVWRLAVFFPALLFGWMREKTGTVVGSTLMHAYANLLQLVIAASFF
jgi:membrane protease YdiL (CAAX protease family)